MVSSEDEFEFGDDTGKEEVKRSKRSVVSRRKSYKDDDDDEEDNFINDGDDDDAPIKTKKKKVKKEESDDDEPIIKKTTKIKIKIKRESSSVTPSVIKSSSNNGSNKKRKQPASDDDDDDDVPIKKMKNKLKLKVKKESDDDEPKKKKKKIVKKESGSNTVTTTQRELKKLDKAERIQYAMQSFLWWNAKDPPVGCQWNTLEHSSVSFPDSYVPHNIPIKYDNKIIKLTPIQEEALTFIAAMDPDGMHLGNPKTSKIFIKNFFHDFQLLLGKKHDIKDFNKIDFTAIRNHLNDQKMIKKAVTDEEKINNKNRNNSILFHYGYAFVDNHIEKVGNYNMEPPGTFRGRGEHPKMGKLKQRVLPEQVSINTSENAPIPKCPVPGHAWCDVRHDPRGMWLATWKENINNQSKYMQLAAQSSFKGKSDRSKYNKAALLCKNIIKIRQSYKKDLKSKDQETKELATGVWVIDRLALRVGGEKDTDEEADTVGCCSLRVEHLHFDPNEEGGDNCEIELEFLGKDSMLYKQTIDFGAALYNDDNGMGSQVYTNLKAFCKNKKKGDDVFTTINPTILNNHLKQFMDGLSAKVFRTYNASKTLQDQLMKQEKLVSWKNLSDAEKVIEYNGANREVAILCNHQRSVSKAQETQLENLGGKLNLLKKQKKQLKGILKKLSKGESDGIPVRKSFESMKDDVDKIIAKAKKMKESATTNEEKIAATHMDEKAKDMKRTLGEARFQKAHLWESIPNKEQVVKRIHMWSTKISKMELDLKHKDDNKEVSLGTSKINYMDPRISVAFCKRNDIPIEKIFSKTLRDKFNWAMAVEPEWEFHERVYDE